VPCERRVGHVGLVGKGLLTRGFPVGVVGGPWGPLEILRTPSGLPALSHLGNRDRTGGLSIPGSPRSKTGLGPTRDTHPVAVASPSIGRRPARYRQLATSRLINHPVKWQLRGGQGVDSEGYIDRPDDEVMRGALTLFRQIYVGSEPASFGVVKNILARRSLERGEAGTEALRQIRMWAQAHSDLERAPLPTLADEAVIACEEGREPGPVDWPEDLRPDTLIKTYAYGDFIHWGDRAQDRQAYASSVAMDVLTMSHLLDVVCGFSHLYMGFALVVNQALHEWNDAFGHQF